MRYAFPLFLFLCTLFPTTAYAEMSGTLASDPTSLFTGAPGGTPQATAPKGTVVPVESCGGGPTSCAISYNGQRYFVLIDDIYIEGFSDPKTKPAGPAEKPAETGADHPSDRVTVNNDVDLYDVPGGVGTVIGMLEKDSKHTLLQCKSDNWCQVDSGWVWGDFLDR